jgi:hypothetical protein
VTLDLGSHSGQAMGNKDVGKLGRTLQQLAHQPLAQGVGKLCKLELVMKATLFLLNLLSLFIF